MTPFSHRNNEFTETPTHPKQFMLVSEWTGTVKFTVLFTSSKDVKFAVSLS